MRTYWVENYQLMAGEYPGSFDGAETLRRLRWLLKLGVNSFVDLTQAGEANLPTYDQVLRSEAKAAGKLVKYNRLPIPDMDIPSDDEMRSTLNLIEREIRTGDCVYVHCYGGKGRTGTVIGCYLVEQGLAGDEAIERIAQLRNDPLDGRVRSPETEEQREMVFRWLSGQS